MRIRRAPKRARAIAALTAGVVALGTVGGASAASVAAARRCHVYIGHQFQTASLLGFKNVNKCHSLANSTAQPGGACNDTSALDFDPFGKYGAAKARAATLTNRVCLAPDSQAILDQYDGGNAANAVEPAIDDAVGGNSLLVLGSMNLNGDKAKVKCLNAIATARNLVAGEIVKESVKCQRQKDLKSQTFGAIDPACVKSAVKSTPTANSKIAAGCGALTGDAVGACTPLPGCVVNTTTQAAQQLVQDFFHKKAPPPLCGNGVVETGEQCDDGASNGQPGDLCNAGCESLANTCGPGTIAGGSFIGHRVVDVALTIPDGPSGPQQLAGVQVSFDYPQLLASIHGTGGSSVVQNAVQLLQTAPASALTLASDSDSDFKFLVAAPENFIASGPFMRVTLDECVANALHTCNRSQNIVGCCPATDIDACNADPEDGAACFCNTFGATVTAGQCASASCSTGACPAGGPLDMATCVDCPTLPGCFQSYNPPVCGIGHFPPQAVGMCTGPSGGSGGAFGDPSGCPSGNDCISQDALVKKSCSVANPVDALARPIDGVTCTITITETQ